MDPETQRYINKIRANTAYPVYRGIIGTITILGYILAVFFALSVLILGAISGDFWGLPGSLVLGAILFALIFLATRFWKEAALMLADIADSITNANSRSAQDSGQ
ncbi:MAG: hypothetical protein Kow001_10270 [Acidobacteriota bacterium]